MDGNSQRSQMPSQRSRGQARSHHGDACGGRYSHRRNKNLVCAALGHVPECSRSQKGSNVKKRQLKATLEESLEVIGKTAQELATANQKNVEASVLITRMIKSLQQCIATMKSQDQLIEVQCKTIKELQARLSPSGPAN